MIGVQYYGEWRTFRIIQLYPLDAELDSSSSPVKHPLHSHPDQDITHKLSEMALDDSSMEEHGQSRENADTADSSVPLEEIPTLKVTARSRILVADSSKTKPSKNKVKDWTSIKYKFSLKMRHFCYSRLKVLLFQASLEPAGK